jgi:hypothetical protein
MTDLFSGDKMDQEWEEIVEGFRQHFGESKVEESGDEVVFDSGSSKFMVSSSGYVEGSMPLHSFIADSFDDIKFEKDYVKVFSGDTIYEFKK